MKLFILVSDIVLIRDTISVLSNPKQPPTVKICQSWIVFLNSIFKNKVSVG